MEIGVFNTQVDRYDAWYDTPGGRAAFQDEIEALRPLLRDLPRPWLEVGVGTGRAAAALGVDFGIDPAPGALRLAARRGIDVALARGEALPFRESSCGAVVLVVTLCFVQDALAVLREARRVLRPGGALVIGMLPAEGPWGRHYQALAAQGHAYYRHAHFFTRAELLDLLSRADLRPVRSRSALFWSPSEAPVTRGGREGDLPTSGFTATLVAPSVLPRT